MIADVKECLSCTNPECEKGCPLHNRIRDIIKYLKDEDVQSARNLLAKTAAFPYICSRICNFEGQCVGHCIKNRFSKPVKINEIEQWLAQFKEDVRRSKDKKVKVAVLGAGPAGLTVSKYLLLKGYGVDIYDREDFMGGTLESGIPSFRLDRQFIQMAKDEVSELGAVFVKGQDIDAKTFAHLREKYEKVVVAFGAMAERIPNLTNAHYAKGALEVLRDLNVSKKEEYYRDFKKAYVVGGGNSAMDVARCLKRLGVDTTIVYRRSKKEMPASPVEINEALEDGCKILEHASPVRIVVSAEKITALEIVRTRPKKTDESGRIGFEDIKGSEMLLEGDLIVFATGQVPEVNIGVKLDERGRIIIDDHHQTSIKGVYAAGDCVLGPTNVARAMRDARECFEGMEDDF